MSRGPVLPWDFARGRLDRDGYLEVHGDLYVAPLITTHELRIALRSSVDFKC